MEMKTVAVNGMTIAYREAGQGRTLLLLHAFPLSSQMWEPQLTELADVAHLIAPDLRGFGITNGEAVTSLDDYAHDLKAFMDALQIEKATLVGLSMGGYIAFACLRLFPERVEGLVLMDTRATADNDEQREARETNAQLVEREGVTTLVENMMPKLVAAQASDALQKQVRAIGGANSPAGVAAALRAMAKRPDVRNELVNMDVPTLVIVGSEDALTPPSDSQELYAALPDVRMVTIPNAGHLSNLEQPEAVNKAIREFLTPAVRYGRSGSSSGNW